MSFIRSSSRSVCSVNHSVSCRFSGASRIPRCWSRISCSDAECALERLAGDVEVLEEGALDHRLRVGEQLRAPADVGFVEQLLDQRLPRSSSAP
jgi:hypothetical protein